MKRLLASSLLLAVLLTVFSWQIAHAADAVVGTGSPAGCTEAAFDAALLAAGNGGGVITFDCGPAVHTVQFTVSKTVILGDVTIDGGGRIVLAAGPNERHFFAGPITFRLRHITLQGGDALVNGGAIEASGAQVSLDRVQLLNNRSSVLGGAIYCYDGSLTIRDSRIAGNQAETGGAIYNDGCRLDIANAAFTGNRASATGRGGAVANALPGELTARNTRFEANYALDGGGFYNAGGASARLASVTFAKNTAGYGGGVENSGALTVTHSLFDDNSVTGSGGGLWNAGGAALIEKTTFSNNFAYEGGGVKSDGTALELREVNLVSNVANALSGAPNGGGLYHGGGATVVTNATIHNNYAASNGGGIYQASDDNLTLTNVTIAENVATGLGGGLYHFGRYAVLTNATFANNQAGVAGSALYEDSPKTAANPGVVQLVNSVVFGSAVNCDGGLFESLGHNLSQGTCASLNDPTDQDAFTGNLQLSGLAYQGGSFPMQTLLPQAGSPLIDAGDPTACEAADQRGASRVGTCDLGAVEYGAAAFGLYVPLLER